MLDIYNTINDISEENNKPQPQDTQNKNLYRKKNAH